MNTWIWIIILIVSIFLTMTLSLMMASKRIDRNLNQRSIGTIKMQNDPDGSQYLFAEFDQGGFDTLQQSEYVIMKVDLGGYLK